MRENDRQLGWPFREYVDTKANIAGLALGGADEGCVAYATDTNQIGRYTGAAWAWDGPPVAAAGNVLVSTAANNWGADLTPLWMGTHTWGSGFAVMPTDATGQALGDATHRWDLHTQAVFFEGTDGNNTITVPDNVVDALHIWDSDGLEYMRIVSTDANPYFLIDPAGAGINVGIGTAVPPALFTVAGVMQWGGVAAPYARSDIDGTGLWIEQTGTDTADEDIRIQTSKSGDGINYAQFFIDPTDGFSFMGIGTGNYLVGMGTATPGSYLNTAYSLVIYTAAHTGMTIASGTTHEGNIAFADGTAGDDRYRGLIRYDHNTNFLKFFTNAAERVSISNVGVVNIANLAGVGVRAVVADAAGNLSAP